MRQTMVALVHGSKLHFAVLCSNVPSETLDGGADGEGGSIWGHCVEHLGRLLGTDDNVR